MEAISFFVLAVFAIISGFQVTASCPSDKDKPWSFDPSLPNGPPHWPELFEDCANYKIQSPINIPSRGTKRVMGATGLNVTNYDKPLKKVQVTNNGYTVVMEPQDGIKRSVTFNGSTSSLKKLILRFGEKMVVDVDDFPTNYPSSGSDHRVDGRQLTAELQLIHGDKKSMVIISALLQFTFNPDAVLDSILDDKTLSNIQYEGDTYVKNLNKTYARLDNVAAPFSPVYEYKGSFSTPPCTPGVTWLILKEPKIVGLGLLLNLFQLHSVKEDDPNVDKCYLKNSFRSPQPLAGRTVYSY